LNFESVQDSGKSILLKLNVNDGTNDGTIWMDVMSWLHCIELG
jgi:hypothetical protein